MKGRKFIMLTKEQRAKIVKLYYLGKFPGQIAKLLKIGRETVRRIIAVEKEKIIRQSEEILQKQKDTPKSETPNLPPKPKPIYKEDAKSDLKLRKEDYDRYAAIKKSFDS